MFYCKPASSDGGPTLKPSLAVLLSPQLALAKYSDAISDSCRIVLVLTSFPSFVLTLLNSETVDHDRARLFSEARPNLLFFLAKLASLARPLYPFGNHSTG